MTEAELAQKFIPYIRELGYDDLYFELLGIDIIAREKHYTVGIEVKTSLNFKVIEQAYENLQHKVNYSYVAVPHSRDQFFQKKICRDYGIGIIEYHRSGYAIMDQKAKFNRHNNPKKIPWNDIYKQAMPGTKNGEHGIEVFSPFKLTVQNLELYVKYNPGCSLRSAANNIEYHYKTLSTAKSCLFNYIKTGVIKTIRIERGKLYLKEQG